MRFFIPLFCVVTLCFSLASAQGINPSNQSNNFNQQPFDPNNPEDTLNNADTMRTDWSEDSVIIYSYLKNSQVKNELDTSLFSMADDIVSEQFAWAHLGNFNSAGKHLLYQLPEFEGKSGRNEQIYSPYLFDIHRSRFYHTNLPYSEFSFFAIGQNQQQASILHTQNVRPNWNFSFNLMGNSSEGDFIRQKTQQFSGNFTSHYKSPNQRYNSYFSLFFNSNRQNENGGIVSEDYLSQDAFSDRQRIPTNIGEQANLPDDQSPITQKHRDFFFDWTNNYSVGVVDTFYSDDSTSYQLSYTPRLIAEHQFQWRNYQYLYEDKRPNAEFYNPIISLTDLSYNDSIYSKRNWQVIDNQFSLAGNFGKGSKQLKLKGGIGLKNQFYKQYRDIEENTSSSLWGTYVFGNITKEALTRQDWDFNLQAQLFFTGEEAGNFQIKGKLEKGIKEWAHLAIHAHQTLQSPSWYQQKRIFNIFEIDNESLQNEAITNIGGSLKIPKLKLTAFTNQYFIQQMITLQEDWSYTNAEEAVYISQIGIRNQFQTGIFYLHSEGIYQELNDQNIVSLPTFLIKERIGIETYIFKKALLINTGFDVIWYTPFKQSQYVPLLNDFIHTSEKQSSNIPIIHFNLNFKVKGFRGFASVQHLQHLISTNQSFSELYPYRNTYFIFGFNWRLLK